MDCADHIREQIEDAALDYRQDAHLVAACRQEVCNFFIVSIVVVVWGGCNVRMMCFGRWLDVLLVVNSCGSVTML